MTDIADLPARSQDGHVHVYVEIPRGNRNKYELEGRDLRVRGWEGAQRA